MNRRAFLLAIAISPMSFGARPVAAATPRSGSLADEYLGQCMRLGLIDRTSAEELRANPADLKWRAMPAMVPA